MTESRILSPITAAALAAVPLGISAGLGAIHRPTPDQPKTFLWYRSLDKPPFTPPDIAFGIVWPAIQAGLAWGGYRLLRQPPTEGRNLAVGLWALNVTAIGAWNELFFGGKKLGASALGAGAMVAGGAAFSAVAAKVDRRAAATGVPFVAWLCFATLLATEVWRRNRPAGDERAAPMPA